MSEEYNYSKRELDFHFETINDKLDSILVQTTKTNGRVSKCEENISNLKTSGRVANWAFGITVPAIIGMALWIYFYQINLVTAKIDEHIKTPEKKLEVLPK